MTCPYGLRGDRLWVRETWATYGMEAEPEQDRPLFFRADDDTREGWATPDDLIWRPAIHMRRWASRITLEITSIRVERVQDISEKDARAEGVTPEFEMDAASFVRGAPVPASTYVLGFKHVWNEINGARGFGWDVNPWVWVIEFRKATEPAIPGAEFPGRASETGTKASSPARASNPKKKRK